MKVSLASPAATIALMMLGAVPATGSYVFVARDATAQQIRIDRSAAAPLTSIPSPTSNAVCTSPHGEPATITVTGTATKGGQPEAYRATLLGTCHIPPDSAKQTGAVIATAFTDPGARDMALHITDLAYAPPPATDLLPVRSPDGASVFSGPADARSASRVPSSLADINDTDQVAADAVAFTSAYNSGSDTSGAGVRRNTNAHAGAMTVTVARFGDYGPAGPVLDRFRSTDVDRYFPADASALNYAAEPGSVFIMQPDTHSALPAGDFGWHVGVVPQTPKPNRVGTGAHPSLSATVARHGVSPTYTNVLAAMP